jgi:TRAP transporter TAXI family solute receptor
MTTKRITIIAAAAAVVLGATAALSQQQTFITIGSGSTTGLYYPTAVGIAKIVTESDIGVRANARSTGGSVFNAKAIGDGQMQMGLMQNNIAAYAYQGAGVEAFKDKPIKSLAGIAALYPEVVHVLAREDAKIASPADLKGKKVYVGDVGSGTEQDAINIMAAYGVQIADLQNAVRGSAGNAVNLLRDNRIDAMFYTVGIGSSAIVEAAQTAPIRVVSIGADKITELNKKFAFYTSFTIPKGTYPEQENDATTVTLKAMLAADAKLPEEAVYKFTKTVFGDKLQAFYNDIQNPNLKKYFKVENALDGMPIPLHPGAARFFKEAGVKISGDLEPGKK